MRIELKYFTGTGNSLKVFRPTSVSGHGNERHYQYEQFDKEKIFFEYKSLFIVYQ
jgi:hypothetical protein